MMDKLRFLKVSLAAVLAIVGLKMLLAEPLKAALGPGFNLYLLLVVLVILASGVLASLWTGPEIKPEELLEGRRRDTAPSEETMAEVESNVDVSNVERPG
jgi:predicted tellurium resistance membrane protein TerC